MPVEALPFATTRLSSPDSHDSDQSTSVPVVLHTRVVTGTGGGPDKTILNSPRFLAKYGYRTVCAYLHPPTDPGFESIRQRGQALNADVVSVPDRGPFDWRVVQQLLRICQRERVSIWHGHDYKTNALGLLLRRYWPIRLVTTVHGWVKHTSRTPYYYWIDRHCLRRYERVICVSEDLRDECLKLGVPSNRCQLIENAIDTSIYRRTLSFLEAKVRCGFSPNRRLIGAVGRLSEEKGFEVLIGAVTRLVAQGYDVELAIAGEGDYRPRLEALINQQPDPSRFHLLGHRADLLELYQAMDIFALSSLREGLPNVLLEAMALEVPVVATRIAGIPRLLDEGSNGLLVEPGDVETLAGALTAMLQDAEQRRQFAERANDAIAQRYSFDARMARIHQVYSELLGQTNGEPATKQFAVER